MLAVVAVGLIGFGSFSLSRRHQSDFRIRCFQARQLAFDRAFATCLWCFQAAAFTDRPGLRKEVTVSVAVKDQFGVLLSATSDRNHLDHCIGPTVLAPE